MAIAVPQGVIGESLARGLCAQSFKEALSELVRKTKYRIYPAKQSRTAIFNAGIKSMRQAFSDILIAEYHQDNGKKSHHDFVLLMPGEEFIGIYLMRVYAYKRTEEEDLNMLRGVISIHAYSRYIQSYKDATAKKFGKLMWPHVQDISSNYHIPDAVSYTTHDSGVCVWEQHRENSSMWIMKTFVAADAIDGHGKIGAAWRKYNAKIATTLM